MNRVIQECWRKAIILFLPAFLFAQEGIPAQAGGIEFLPSSSASLGDHAAFIENKGQWDARAIYMMRTPNCNLWLTRQGFVYDLFTLSGSGRYGALPEERTGYAVGMTFLHAAPNPAVQGAYRLPGIYNYFIGNDSTRWATGASLYSEISYRHIYSGIDARLYTQTGKPRYDFIVDPGADASVLAMVYEGAKALRVEGNDLHILTGLGDIVQSGLTAYQIVGSERVTIPCSFRVNNNTVSFNLGEYDHTLPLIIDPLVYSTFVGGSQGDESYAIALDNNKSTYITGTSLSTNFPVVLGAFSMTKNSSGDIIVTKMSNAGSTLMYSTFIGGNGDDYAYDIAVNASGNAYITGVSFSSDYPLAAPYDATLNGDRDIIVTKLAPDGNALAYSTYVGGSGWDEGYGIAVDGAGNAYITGMTTSGDYPIQNPYDSDLNGAQDVCVTKLNGSGNALVFSTFLGGANGDQGNVIIVDNSGNVYVGGSTGSSNFPTITGSYDVSFNSNSNTLDGFVAKFTPGGASLLFSTFIGGTLNDEVKGLALDAQNNIYAAGPTESSNFPIIAGAYDGSISGIDGFIAKLNNTGSSLLASTFLGGNNEEQIFDIASDGQYIYVAGYTRSGDYPTTANGFKQTASGDRDGFLAKFNTTLNAGSLQYSTYAGGSSYDEGRELAVDNDGNAYITGITRSDNFPTTTGGYDTSFNGLSDAFIMEIGTSAPTIALRAPSDGEAWCTGFKQTVLWSSRSVTYIRIELSSNGGASYSTVLADNVPAALGTWVWNIPADFTPGNQYRIRIVNTANSAIFDAGKGNFTINSSPRITTQPQSVVGCKGQTVQFSSTAFAQPAASVQWQMSANTGASWTVIPGATTAVLTLVNIQLSQNNLLYRAVFSNSCKGNIISDSARLLIRTQPVILRAPTSQALCIGGPIELQVEADEPGVSYQWRKNGQPIDKAVGQKFSLQKTSAADAGVYDVVVTGFCPPGIISSAATLSVQDIPVVTPPAFKNVRCPGEARTTTCTLENTGPLDITVKLVSFSNAHFTLVNPSGDFIIASKQRRQLDFRFTPTEALTEIGDVTFNILPCDQQLVLNIGATADSVRLVAADVQFDAMHQCDTFQTQKVRIENTGTLPLSVTEAQFSDPQFTLISPDLPFIVEAHKSTEAVVRFRSDGSFGVFPSSAVFVTDMCSSLSASSALLARREEVKFQAAQGLLDFGTLDRCASAVTKEFMLFNLGTSPVIIDSVFIDNPAFIWGAPVLPFEIKPGDNRVVRVQFVSGKSGLSTGTLNMREQSCHTTCSIQVRGEKKGENLAPNIAFVQFRAALPCIAAYDTTIVFTNHETDTVIIERGTVPIPFQIISPDFPQYIAPGKTLDVIVRSAPSYDGTFMGTALFPYHTTHCTDTVRISVGSVRVSPHAIAFPQSITSLTLEACEAWKDTSIVLENTGSAEITISNIDIGPGWTVLSKLPLSLNPQGKDTIRIRFEPEDTQPVADILRIHMSPCDTVLQVALSGVKHGIAYAMQSSIGGDTIRFDQVLNCGVQKREALVRISVSGEGQSQSKASKIALAAPFSTTLTNGAMLGPTQEYSVFFEPKGEGTFTSSLTVTFEPCGITKTLVLVGKKTRAVFSGKYDIENFGKMATGKKQTKKILFLNTGGAEIHVDSLGHILPPFALLSTMPALPADLLPGDSIVAEVEYTAGEGKQAFILTAWSSGPCPLVAQTEIKGEGVSLPLTTLTASPFNFGPVMINTLLVGNISIANTGTSDALLLAPVLTGGDAALFSIVAPVPDHISAGENAILRIQFLPISTGLKNTRASMEYNGKTIEIDLSGQGIEPGSHTMETSLSLPDVQSTPFTKGIGLPLLFSPGENFVAAAADSFQAEIRFNSSLFLPLNVEHGMIAGDTVIEQDAIFERILTLNGKYEGRDTLLILYGDVLLGDAVTTPLTLGFTWKNKDIAAATQNGSLTLTGVSEIGGLPRLVRSKDPLEINAIVPNPSSEKAHIVLTTLEVGQHRLQVCDATGRELWSRRWIVSGEDPLHSKTQTFVFDSEKFATGVYTILLASPTHLVSGRIVIVR